MDAEEIVEEIVRHDSSQLDVGDRVSIDGYIGTVKFIGLVASTNGVWLGVDWDETCRGKHDGTHQNKKYFQTRLPTSGSFIRPSKVDTGINALKALQERYGLKEGTGGVDEEDLFVLDDKFNQTVVEMVGAEKVNKLQSAFNRLKKVCFYNMGVYGAGPSTEFGTLCPSITDLDLSRNLVSSWESVAQIAKQLPNLRDLNVSENQLVIPKDPQSLAASFPRLTGVTLNKMGLSWDEIITCCRMFPSLEEIHACFNNISELSIHADDLKCLRTLDLLTNSIQSWDEILKLGNLPHLDTIFLSENKIKSVYFPDCVLNEKSGLFKKLKVLFLKENEISEWSSVDELNKLHNLEELELAGNPIMKTYNIETVRQLRIAKLENVKIISRTPVTYEERKGAEIDYLKRFGAEWNQGGGHSDKNINKPSKDFETKHPRFQKLIDKWGAPEESELQEKTKTIKDSLLDIKISSTAHIEQRGIVSKKLPGTISVLKLKTLVQRLFKMGGEPTLSYTSHKMTSWYRKLIPSVDITFGRLQHKINRLENKFKSVADKDVFLSIPVDFDEVPSVLQYFHLDRSVLLTQPSEFVLPEDAVLTNEVVFALDQFRSREGLSMRFVVSWLRVLIKTNDIYSLMPKDSQISYAAWKVLKDIKKIKCSHSLENLKKKFCEPFSILTSGNNTNSNNVLKDKKEIQKQDNVLKDEKEIQKQDNVLKDKKEKEKHIKMLREKTIQLEKECLSLKLENDVLIDKCSTHKFTEKQLLEKISSLEIIVQQLNHIQQQHQELQVQWNDVKKAKTYRVNTQLRKLLEKTTRKILEVRSDNKTLRALVRDREKEVFSLKNEIDHLRLLRKKVKNEQTKYCKLRKRLIETEEELNKKVKLLSEVEDDKIKFREEGRGRKFLEPVRLAYIALQNDANVSGENCGKVVQIVLKNLLNVDIDLNELPKSSSAMNFQNESYIISRHQILEEIKSCKHFTFACDGTSRDKEHYLEKHIILDNGKELSLGFSKIASDNSDTLLESLIDIFNELCDMSEGDQTDHDVLFNDILCKLKCLLSDRAEVMKCFDSKVAKYKNELLNDEDASTHFVYCNAHFLLGLSTAAEKALKVIEKKEVENGEKLGRDSCSAFGTFQDCSETAALRLIRLASSAFGPRGDEKSGCRSEWLAYCSRIGVKSLFSSYRTNRFNNVFYNATALLCHKDHILSFLNDYASNSNLKLKSIIEDLNDERVMSLIAALSLFHVFFTEPYWKLMQCSKKTHGDFPLYVRKMESILSSWDSEDICLDAFCSVFDDFPAVVPIDYFTLFTNFSLVKKYFLACLKEYDIVFRRQLKDFLDGGIFGGEIDDDIMAILKTCPLTNLTGERLFGDLDYDKKRRRNASLFSSAAKIMWKRNKSYYWFLHQNNKIRQKLIAKAIKMGPVWREKSRKSNKAVLEKIKRKIVENKERKLGKQIKDAENKKEVVDWVISHGGLCDSKKELDKLMEKKNRHKHIQYQIKARKLLFGEAINSSGSLTTLYRRLINHLGFSGDSTSVVPPPLKRRKLDE